MGCGAGHSYAAGAERAPGDKHGADLCLANGFVGKERGETKTQHVCFWNWEVLLLPKDGEVVTCACLASRGGLGGGGQRWDGDFVCLH